MASPRSESKAAAAAAASEAEATLDLEAQKRSDIETRISNVSTEINSSSSVWTDVSNPVAEADAPQDMLSKARMNDVVVQKSRWTGRSMCCLSCCPLSLVLIVLLVVCLRPREPEWDVEKLIVPPAALNSCIQALTQPDGKTTTFGLDALVDFSNPNYIGAEAGEGHVVVTWEGHEIASVTTDAAWAPARKHSRVVAHSTSVITPELGNLLMQTLPGQGFQMQVSVKGELTATVRALFGLRVKVSLDCVVDASVLLIMSDPDKLVTGHKCTYGVRL